MNLDKSATHYIKYARTRIKNLRAEAQALRKKAVGVKTNEADKWRRQAREKYSQIKRFESKIRERRKSPETKTPKEIKIPDYYSITVDTTLAFLTSGAKKNYPIKTKFAKWLKSWIDKSIANNGMAKTGIILERAFEIDPAIISGYVWQSNSQGIDNRDTTLAIFENIRREFDDNVTDIKIPEFDESTGMEEIYE